MATPAANLDACAAALSAISLGVSNLASAISTSLTTINDSIKAIYVRAVEQYFAENSCQPLESETRQGAILKIGFTTF